MCRGVLQHMGPIPQGTDVIWMILTLCTDFFTLLIDIMYSAAWGSDALVCCGTWCT